MLLTFFFVSVQLMSGGPAFLRPAEELTVRFCYVNFDGGPGLAYSMKLGMDTPLPDDFVINYAKPVHDGIMVSVRGGWEREIGGGGEEGMRGI